METDSICWLITVSGPASSLASLEGQAVLRPQGGPRPSSGDRGVGPAQMGKRGLEPQPSSTTPAPTPRLQGTQETPKKSASTPAPHPCEGLPLGWGTLSFVSDVGYFTEHGRGTRAWAQGVWGPPRPEWGAGPAGHRQSLCTRHPLTPTSDDQDTQPLYSGGPADPTGAAS